jgi:hypothetical protein
MALRWIGVVVLLMALSPSSMAAERTGLFHRISCTLVRYYVAKYTAPAAEEWARSKGASESEIEAARHCLAGGATQTAQAAGYTH